jgi:predicted AlkP superfamily pyrophosphatase or phosphodiesterase
LRLRWIRLLIVSVACGISALPGKNASPTAEPRTKKVLLIGIDGVRSDALKIAHMPHLQSLIKGGAFADDTQILGERYRLNDTLSAPGWASILTGVWADKHGVQGSGFEGNNFERYPDFLRRLRQARSTARTAAFVSWEEITRHLVPSADALKTFLAGKRSPAGYLEADRQVAEAAARHLLEADPDAVFVYFRLPDAIGHRSGFHPRVPEYRAAIEAVDGLAAIVVAAMRSRKTFVREDWLILVTSDHGGQGTHHTGGHQDPEVLTVFLIISGPAARPGKIGSPTYIVDSAVTALTHLNVKIDLAWGLDGRAVGLVRK